MNLTGSGNAEISVLNDPYRLSRPCLYCMNTVMQYRQGLRHL